MLKIGMKFNRLTITAGPFKGIKSVYSYDCLCECGNTKRVQKHHLRDGRIQSCGCLKIELTNKQTINADPNLRWKHPLYNIWKGMLRRCETVGDKDYYAYGGRGITVCKEWHDFNKFVEDMAPRTSLSHSLDREDNDGPYNKANCTWATKKEQCVGRVRKGQRRINQLKTRMSADPSIT